jgi:hypothetical protein
VGDASLFSGDFKIEPRLPLRHDVVQLASLSEHTLFVCPF